MGSLTSSLSVRQPSRQFAARSPSRALIAAVGTNPPLRRRGCKTVTRQQLVDVLKARRRADVVTIVAENSPRLRKTGNPFSGRVRKVSRLNGVIGFDYENVVNRQRARHGDPEAFEAQPRTWGQRVANTPLVEHNGQFYLEVKVERTLACQFFIDGKPVDAAVVKPWLLNQRADATNQGERRIVPLDFRLTSIRQIAIGGRLFVVLAD